VNTVPVKIGICDDNYWEITDGLTNGQEIVSGGYRAISRDLDDGKKIKKGTPDKGEARKRNDANPNSEFRIPNEAEARNPIPQCAGWMILGHSNFGFWISFVIRHSSFGFPQMSLIRLQNVSRRYQMGAETVHALRDVSLEIQRGEYVAIMGRPAPANPR